MSYATHISKKVATPQSQPVFEHEDRMVKNDAGGYVYDAGNWTLLERFLTIGTIGGTYYVDERKHTIRAVKEIIECIKEDGQKVIDRTVYVSTNRQAPSNDPALFVMALCMSPKYADTATRKSAAGALHKVARTGSHLFYFLSQVDQIRGWGKLLRTAVGNWYNYKDADRLAYQVIKYRNRYGWTHRDALRKAHPDSVDLEHDVLYGYITLNKHAARPTGEGFEGSNLESILPEIVAAFEAAQKAESETDIIGLISAHRLTHEMIPNQWKKSPAVWEALLQDMPLGAMVRNLGVMTSNGLIKPFSDAASHIVEQLGNKEVLRKSGLHPISILKALTVYGQGKGQRGKLSWQPAQAVSNALEQAFYDAFEYVEPTGENIFIGLDVSGSMHFAGSQVAGMANITAAELAAAMMMVTVRTEANYEVLAFSHKPSPFNVAKTESLGSITSRTYGMTFGATDCSLPMIWALENGINATAFVIYTDGDTWYGKMHPMQALNLYREKTGIPAKLVVVNTNVQRVSIADPQDLGTLDIVGFNTGTPRLLANFIAGR